MKRNIVYMYIPVAMDVRSAEGERIVDEGRIDHESPFRTVEKVRQVEEVPVTASDSVTGAILV